jgi:hypothetical protein
MVDPCFGVDHYNRAKVLSESKTTAYNILTILFGKPGCFPSLPQIGMNIKQYLYEFEDSFDCEAIKAILASQCSDFVENIRDGTFNVYQDRYNGQPMLVFSVPIFVSGNESEIVLGVTTTASGELIFNYTFEKNQYI